MLAGELPFRGSNFEEKLQNNAKAQLIISERRFANISA
jgi:hypothetical protein